MNLRFRELAALYCFFYYDNPENQTKYPIKFAMFQDEVRRLKTDGEIFPVSLRSERPGLPPTLQNPK